MRLIQFIKQYFITPMLSLVPRPIRNRVAVAKLRYTINKRAKQFGLSPDLPELVDLKAALPDAINQPFFMPGFLIDKINPWEDFSWSEQGTFWMHERWFGHALEPWTVADFHVPDLRERLTRIVVDGSGLHLYDAEGFQMAGFEACKCDPHRLADPGNRLDNAAYVVNHYTGIEITGQDLWQKYSATFERHGDVWQTVELSLDPATA